jgi:hypothetical protein
MGTCVFQTAAIRRCVEHALTAKKWEMGYEEGMIPPSPALLFVHDQGVYVMSNGVPRDFKNPAKPDDGSYVAYAEGCNPAIGTFDEWYGMSRELVGGDDFAEVISVKPDWLDLCDKFEHMCVTVTAKSLEIYFERAPVETPTKA